MGPRCLEALQDVDGGYPGFVMDMLASTPPESITEHPLFYRCGAQSRVLASLHACAEAR